MTKIGEVIHGHKRGNGRTPTYSSYRCMIERCEREDRRSYPSHGARGISVCARWRENFQNFLEDMGERPDGKTIDRIDPDGNYEPSNCRWATAKEQATTRRGVAKGPGS